MANGCNRGTWFMTFFSRLISGRRIVSAGLFTALILLGIGAPSGAFGKTEPAAVEHVRIERLGPGIVSFPVLGSVVIGETLYVGSRNLTPTRVAGFHLPTGRVTTEFTLGNGVYVQSLAADGDDAFYAGVSSAKGETNLYRCDIRTGEVTEVAVVPGQSVAALAVASDETVYTSGRPEGRTRGPAVFAFDPKTGNLANFGVPKADVGQSLAVAVTDTTVYFGCGASSAGGGRAGLFAIDRASGEIADILPPRMARDRGINKIEILGDLLVVGGSQVGVMDLVSGVWQFTKVGGRQHQFTRFGDKLIVSSSGGLHQIDLKTWSVSPLGDPGAGFGDTMELETAGDLLFGSMSGGRIWEFAPASGETRLHDLIDAGTSGGPEAGQSVGTLQKWVYVGGNNSIAVHDPSGGATTKLAIPGEVKDMIAVGDTMYMATYAPAALWAHRPADGAPPRRLTLLPPSQNRPHVVRWDEVNQRLMIGTRSDGGGGSLCVFDPATETLTAHINPLGSSQWVWNAAPGHGLVYIAGAIPGGGEGDIAAWDPVAGREVWRMKNPLGEGGGVSGLAVVGQRLFGVAIGGPRLFVIDIGTEEPELIHVGDLGPFATAPVPLPRLLADRGRLYGVSSHAVFSVDPETFAPKLLVDDLKAEWFSGPRLAAGDDHSLYTLSGRDLVRIRPDWLDKDETAHRGGRGAGTRQP